MYSDPPRGNDTCVTSHANPQVVYSEPMAALRTRTLLACNRPIDALAAMEVHYEAPTCVRGAAWRVWLGVQARYLQGDLTVRGGVEQPLPGSRACGACGYGHAGALPAAGQPHGARGSSWLTLWFRDTGRLPVAITAQPCTVTFALALPHAAVASQCEGAWLGCDGHR